MPRHKKSMIIKKTFVENNVDCTILIINEI